MGIGVRHGQHNVFFQQGDGVIIFNGIDGGGQEKVHMILALLPRFAALLQDFKADIRMFLAEAGKEGRNNHGSGEKGNGDREFLGFLGICQFLLGTMKFLHDAVRVAEKNFAVLGEYDIAAVLEKSGTPSSVSSTLMVWDREGWEI